MTDRNSEALSPLDSQGGSPPVSYGGDPPSYGYGYGPPPYGEDPDDGQGLDVWKIPQILWRYKWLMAAAVLLGLGAGYFMASRQAPRFTTQALLQMAEPGPQRAGVTAIEGGVQFSPASWVNLMRSNRVMERVVDDLRLFISARDETPADAFASAEVVGQIRRGSYAVRVDSAATTVQIVDLEERVLESHSLDDVVAGGTEAEAGTDLAAEDAPDQTVPADDGGADGGTSVVLGESLGVALNLDRNLLRPGAHLPFNLQPRRDAARGLQNGIQIQPSASAFMAVSMQGQDPYWIAMIVNSVIENFLEEAIDLSRAQSDELSQTLQEQLSTARASLNQAEAELEAFESATVATGPFAGLAGDGEAAGTGLVGLRVELDQLTRDRERLERLLSERSSDGGLRVQALEAIPSVRESSEMMAVLEQITDRRAEVRSLLIRYTEDHPEVREGREAIRDLEGEAIPALAGELVAELDVRIGDLQGRTDARSDELRAVPAQALTRARLRREVSQAEALFEDVSRRHAAARLAAISAAPDIQIVDRAEPPSQADTDRRMMLALVTLFGFVGAGGVGAILLDLRDKRVRSPADVETLLGLPILGTLPHLATRGGKVKEKDQSQAVEAFRSIRLGLTYAYGAAGPVVLTVSSPAPGDGKSFTTSNLGLSFAELGRRTVVVDGDVRKGTQHTHLGVDRVPGLTDYLSGEVELDDVLQGSRHPLLSVIPHGSLLQNAPEFMVSSRMQDLLAALKEEFDVILVDSPPLGAASDPLILGTLTGSMLLVLRNGATNTDQAGAMLQNLRRYPIRVVGAVLNDVPSSGEYRYYGYAKGYGIPAEAANGRKGSRGLVGAGR